MVASIGIRLVIALPTDFASDGSSGWLCLFGSRMFIRAVVANDGLEWADREDRALLAADGHGNGAERHECLPKARIG